MIALFCREVFFELNGQLRTVFVPDTKAKKSISVNPKAQKGKRDQVGSPMLGTILEVPVKEGDVVGEGPSGGRFECHEDGNGTEDGKNWKIR